MIVAESDKVTLFLLQLLQGRMNQRKLLVDDFKAFHDGDIDSDIQEFGILDVNIDAKYITCLLPGPYISIVADLKIIFFSLLDLKGNLVECRGNVSGRQVGMERIGAVGFQQILFHILIADIVLLF